MNSVGKSLIFTDIHFGINSDKPSRQKIAESVVSELVTKCETESIRTVFFLGDLFHHRTSIEVSTLNLAYNSIRKLSSVAELFLIQGNHDLYEKSGRSLSSTGIFADSKIHVIAVPTEIELNGQTVLLVPWCGDGGEVTIRSMMNDCGCQFGLKRYDILMGHFNVADPNEISKTAESLKSGILKNESGVYAMSDRIPVCNTQCEEMFAYSHPASQIYMGHIHEHQEILSAKRMFRIVGSPQTQTHDLKGIDPNRKLHGYYVLDESNKPKFTETICAPKFVTIYASEIKNPTSDTKNKLESLEGCVIKRCYDCNLSDEEQKKFDEAVGKSSILEEDSAVFVESGSILSKTDAVQEKISQNDIYGTTKEEFLMNMAYQAVLENNAGSEIDDETLKSETDVVFNRLKKYYEMASGN